MTHAILIGGKNDIREPKSHIVEAGWFRSTRFAILIASALLSGCGNSSTEVTTAPAPGETVPGETVSDETVSGETEVVSSEPTKPGQAEPKSQDGEPNVGTTILKVVGGVVVFTAVIALCFASGALCVM